MKRSSGGEVERLAGQCRFLATVLRKQADDYGILRRSDARFLQAIAEQLDAVADDITTFFSQSDPNHVRGRAWWAKRIAGFLIGGAAIVSGANDALDLLDGGDALGLDTTVINLANETYGAACIVIDLPDDQLRPSAVERSRSLTFQGTAAAAASASGDIHLEGATSSGTAEASDPDNGTYGDGTYGSGAFGGGDSAASGTAAEGDPPSEVHPTTGHLSTGAAVSAGAVARPDATSDQTVELGMAVEQDSGQQFDIADTPETAPARAEALSPTVGVSAAEAQPTGVDPPDQTIGLSHIESTAELHPPQVVALDSAELRLEGVDVEARTEADDDE